MYFFIISTGEAYCFHIKQKKISGDIIVKNQKSKLTFFDKVYFKHSKRKQLLGGVNCIFNDGKHLILGTETGLVRFNKRNFRAERISSKKYNIQIVLKDKGVYWMVVTNPLFENRKLVKYRNGIFSTVFKNTGKKQSYDILKSGKNKGVWIINVEDKQIDLHNGENDNKTEKFIAINTLSGFKKKSFVLDAEIFDYRTDNNGALWIASSKGIYEIHTDNKNRIKSKRFEFVTDQLQILNNSEIIHFISGDTLYSINDGKVSILEYRKGINGTVYVNSSYLKHIENIGDDENACTSGIIEITDNSVKIFNENGLINDTEKVFTRLKEHFNEDYMDNVSSYLVLPNGQFLFLVSGHGRSTHCYDGAYIFDGKKSFQMRNLSSSQQLVFDKNKVWIPDGADWYMSNEGIGGGLYLYEY